MSVKTLIAVLHQEGMLWVAECPEIGTVSQGPSIEKAAANLREATDLYIEEFPAQRDIGRSLITTFDVAYA